MFAPIAHRGRESQPCRAGQDRVYIFICRVGSHGKLMLRASLKKLYIQSEELGPEQSHLKNSNKSLYVSGLWLPLLAEYWMNSVFSLWVHTEEENSSRYVGEDGGVEAGREVRILRVPGQARVPQHAPAQVGITKGKSYYWKSGGGYAGRGGYRYN